ncbi:sterol desaturase family protein [Alteromonas sp. DY56-G5]|uniref:sterol desaturase family protein n=1 Tax=Alteromonas TaxID=226 RepID=UPI00128947C7|nr:MULTISPECIES: sterol desaturase family protein [Alteromonas]CAI2389858.1 Sterol desaturase/sphingolipid hydroxylase [Alteromonas macleodii]CAI3951917.1 Sterol desaturase/sphingolipid hydroxylase [Alteromonas macleodii]CAI3952842.1 Sterol desaturase/sphingolipid hydroxylase [Alteromonas macleodii]CAI3952907.1 Sterol desaturase/sphingolipid hydroxylase [Alteromonas macleodii]VTO39454.1 Sterol desaturase/sphingolipid hydroxylase [Alteromonas macleodii]
MDNTAVIRLSVFLGVFVLMAVLEALLPAREAVLSRKTRWLGNLSMVVMGALVSRILLPATLVGVSLWAQQKGIGVFNVLLDAVPADASSSNQLLNSGEPLSNSSTYLVHIAIVTLSVLLLDMLIYWQHRLFHTVPMLWRFHKMHHADSHVDTTTGLRFHPVEIAMSLGIKAGAVVILGVPAIAIIIFEVALNGFALFNHANIRLPQKWDDRIGLVLITQRLHRIHHSQAKNESNSNYGFSVSWWDRLFNSFTPRAAFSDETLPIGQKDVPATKKNASIIALLQQPFKKR